MTFSERCVTRCITNEFQSARPDSTKDRSIVANTLQQGFDGDMFHIWNFHWCPVRLSCAIRFYTACTSLNKMSTVQLESIQQRCSYILLRLPEEACGSSPEAHLARMVFRVRVRVRPFSHSREVRFWTRPKACYAAMHTSKTAQFLLEQLYILHAILA